MRRLLPWAVLATVGLSACMAPGPGGGPGGGPPGGGRMAGADRTLVRDPWQAWAQALRAEAATLAPQPPERAALDDFVSELESAARLRMARVERGMRGQRLSVSATGDVGHELRREAEDADDWKAAVQDLRERWERLHAVLPPPQRARLEALYLDAARSALRGTDDARDTRDGRDNRDGPQGEAPGRRR